MLIITINAVTVLEMEIACKWKLEITKYNNIKAKSWREILHVIHFYINVNKSLKLVKLWENKYNYLISFHLWLINGRLLLENIICNLTKCSHSDFTADSVISLIPWLAVSCCSRMLEQDIRQRGTTGSHRPF